MDKENNQVSFYQILGRTAIQYENFKVNGKFKSLWKAKDWLKERGYSYGSSDKNKSGYTPVSIKEDYPLPQKLKNFTNEDWKKVDGFIFSYNYIEGEVFIYLFNHSKKHKKSIVNQEKYANGLLHKCSKEFCKDILNGRFKIKKTDIKKIAFTTIPDGTINSPDELKQAIIDIYGNEN